ncbi:NHL repeat-containing protein [Edaphobacter modestus]|uniref:NHL repeat-containing protein n=2 Tax=Edaphobacter modestus TaxID=388466 RepID=A0A4Q7YQU7_9BACT|nr:NHL repeat-containing protein [Edaphobacter modestus]
MTLTGDTKTSDLRVLSAVSAMIFWSTFQQHRHLTSRLWASFCLMMLLSVAAEAQTLATSVPLLLPSAIAFDSQGNLYIAETANHVIRKVDREGGITAVAGTGTQGYDGDNSAAISALLDSPQGLAVDAHGLYIADTHNHRVRRVDLINGIITTIAGSSTAGAAGDNGPAAAALLDRPGALALDGKSNLYIADSGSHRIRRIDAGTGVITTVAGAGAQGYEGDNARAVSALLDSPQGIAVDTGGNLYVADTNNHRIRRIDAVTGIITTLAGTGVFGYAGDSSSSAAARLALPQGLSVGSDGNIYLADTANHRIRRIDGTTGMITTVAGDGTQGFSGDGGAPVSASLDSPRATTLSSSGLVTIADRGNQRVRQLSGDTIQTIAGLGSAIPVQISLSGAGTVSYGSGELTASLTSSTEATGSVVFFDQYAGTSGASVVVPLSSNAAVFDMSVLQAGQHTITASYSGDASHSAAQSTAFSLMVNQLPVTAIVAPASLRYGDDLPSLQGSLSGVLPRDQSSISATYSVDLPVHPGVGVYPVGVALTGSAAGNYTVSSAPTLTITKAATITTLNVATATLVSASSVDAGQPVQFSVHVSTTTTVTPTGTILLSDGATLLTAASPNRSGDLTFATSALAAGPHSLSAVYSGDANFLSSTSPTALFVVDTPQVGPGDFTLAPSSATTQTVVSGGSADFSLVVNTNGNISSPVTLSASGLPDLATASFNPGSLPPGTPSGSFVMTIATPKTAHVGREMNRLVFAGFFLVFLPWAGRRYGSSRPRLIAVLLFSSLPLFTGCGDRIRTGSDTTVPPKSYTITVTGTALGNAGTTLQHTATVTLIVQAAN